MREGDGVTDDECAMRDGVEVRRNDAGVTGDGLLLMNDDTARRDTRSVIEERSVAVE